MIEEQPNTKSAIPILNPEQQDASSHIDGPLLVLAGAGTGKTRVLTHRIAHLIESKAAMPGQILAVTFTNKAASEMKQRVCDLIGDYAENMSIGTFHSIAAKILRQYASFLGFTSDFTIVDYDDQLRIVQRILKARGIEDSRAVAKSMLYHISRFKDKAFMPGAVPESEDELVADLSAHEIYQAYQRELKALNAMDFGDLLMYNIELFNNNLAVLEIYQNRYQYILVDEYQDTNVAQYLWLRLLAAKHNNICCVGDDDQSIYGWRGAEITNILRFDRDFEGAKVVRLEQNYRSTKCILEAASGIIAVNNSRHKKKLWTDGNTGELIKLYPCADDQEEARFVADEIDSLCRYKKLNKRNMAILLRAGYQTRSFEEQLNFHHIPYNVVGGTKFYERMEIRDALSYIRFLVNPQDMLAFERMISTPKRGVGQASIQKLIAAAQSDAKPFPELVDSLLQSGIIKGKAASQFKTVMDQFADWRNQLNITSHQEVVKRMLNESGYIQMLKDDKTAQSRDRVDNIRELITSLSEYENLKLYLEHISLVTDTDSMNTDDRISIMTIHAAKGLEFDTVFLGGWEDGIFPSQKAIDENGPKGIEEERRLAYVAITRAKQRLYITSAQRRRIYGHYQNCIPSRFIDEIPRETYEIINQFSSYNNGPQFQNADLGPKRRFGRNPIDKDAKFRCGDRVVHSQFGKGTVVSINGDQATVVFERMGIKKLLSEYLDKAS